MDGTNTVVHEEDQDGVTALHPDRADTIRRLAEISEELRDAKNPFRREALEHEERQLMKRVQG